MSYNVAMIHNEGIVDRVIRTNAGVAILSLVFVGPKTLLGLFGLLPLVTGLTGICPLYNVIGISTCRKEASAS